MFNSWCRRMIWHSETNTLMRLSVLKERCVSWMSAQILNFTKPTLPFFTSNFHQILGARPDHMKHFGARSIPILEPKMI